MSRARTNGNGGKLAGRRILVVEDESLLTMLIEDMLAEIGCDAVETAFAFDDALAKATTLPLHAVVLDINVNGRQTFPIAEALSARRIPFIFATGYGATALPKQFKNVPTLPKPFLQTQLEGALLSVLFPGSSDPRSVGEPG